MRKAKKVARRRTVRTDPTSHPVERSVRAHAELLSVSRRLRELQGRLAPSGPDARKDATLRAKLITRRAALRSELDDYRALQTRPQAASDMPGKPIGNRGVWARIKHLTERIEHIRLGPGDKAMIQAGGQNPPVVVRTLLDPTTVIALPTLWWHESNKATRHTEWHVDGTSDITRLMLYGRWWIKNPEPLLSFETKGAQLAETIAFMFDVPAFDWEATVQYQANAVIGINPFYDAEDPYHTVWILLHEQHDVAQPGPSGPEHFEVLEQINYSGGTIQRTAGATIHRSYTVPAGVASRVYIGMHWNLSIGWGNAGTVGYAWDSLVLGPPPGQDSAGLLVTATQSV